MNDLQRQWSLSNPGPEKLLLWLEPWAEEFEVSPRSTVALSMPGATGEAPIGEVEWNDNHLVFWASQEGVLKVFVDGALQESASAVVPIPEGLTRQMLNVIFENQPAARLGGRIDAGEPTSWWQRARRRLGLS